MVKFMLKCSKIIKKEIQISHIEMLNDINDHNSCSVDYCLFLCESEEN